METIKPAEAAKALGVTSQTVRNYVREGRLDSVPTPGGHNRITVESLDRLKAGTPNSDQWRKWARPDSPAVD